MKSADLILLQPDPVRKPLLPTLGSRPFGGNVGKDSTSVQNVNERGTMMQGHGAKLPRLQEAAIDALLSPNNRNQTQVAESIGITTKTLRRWMQLPDFNDAYLQGRRQIVAQSRARLQRGTATAAVVLMNTLNDKKTTPALRVQTARILFELSDKSLEHDDILMRLDRLEKAGASDGRPIKTEFSWQEPSGIRALDGTRTELKGKKLIA